MFLVVVSYKNVKSTFGASKNWISSDLLFSIKHKRYILPPEWSEWIVKMCEEEIKEDFKIKNTNTIGWISNLFNTHDPPSEWMEWMLDIFTKPDGKENTDLISSLKTGEMFRKQLTLDINKQLTPDIEIFPEVFIWISHLFNKENPPLPLTKWIVDTFIQVMGEKESYWKDKQNDKREYTFKYDFYLFCIFYAPLSLFFFH